MSLLDDITELNRRLEALFEEARYNENTLKKFQSFEITLINCDSPTDFFRTLLIQSREDFDWDITTIALVDSNYAIRRLLSHRDDVLEENSDILFLENAEPIASLFHNVARPLLEPFDPDRHDCLFPGEMNAAASVACLPLFHKHHLAGSFNIGSLDEERFNPNQGTDFLGHLMAIITVCLDNLLSREHLKYLGLVDNLTGVNNRRFFEQRLKEETARVTRMKSPVSCLFVDVDYFKNINDTHGHQVGDQVLRHIATILRDQVRTIDIVARYGGEEFTVILPQTGVEKAYEVAERIRTRIEESPYITDEGNSISLTVSIGVNSLLPEECTGDMAATSREFVERADKSLYIAKKNGRNRTVCYSVMSETIIAEGDEI